MMTNFEHLQTPVDEHSMSMILADILEQHWARAQIKHTIKYKDKEKSNYAFLKQREMENTGFLGVVRRYILRIIFSKIFTD